MVEKSQKIAEMRPGHTFFVCDSDYSSACAATVKRALHENLYPFFTHYTGTNIHTPAQERCCNFFAVTITVRINVPLRLFISGKKSTWYALIRHRYVYQFSIFLLKTHENDKQKIIKIAIVNKEMKDFFGNKSLILMLLFRVEPCEARPQAETELRILERSVNRARAE